MAHGGSLVGVPPVDGALDLEQRIEVSDRSEIRLGPHSSRPELDVAVHQGCFAFPQLHRRSRDHQVEDVRHPPDVRHTAPI